MGACGDSTPGAKPLRNRFSANRFPGVPRCVMFVQHGCRVKDGAELHRSAARSVLDTASELHKLAGIGEGLRTGPPALARGLVQRLVQTVQATQRLNVALVHDELQGDRRRISGPRSG